MKIDSDDPARFERVAEQPERLTLPAAHIDDHRSCGQGSIDQALEIVDRDPQHVMLPRGSTEEP
jgi:hypothetical protein